MRGVSGKIDALDKAHSVNPHESQGMNRLKFTPRRQRYLILKQTYNFKYYDAPPYTVTRQMLWSADKGFYELGADSPKRLAYIVDFQTELHGYIMQSEKGTFVFWMRKDWGDDGHPHVARAEWIESLTL